MKRFGTVMIVLVCIAAGAHLGLAQETRASATDKISLRDLPGLPGDYQAGKYKVDPYIRAAASLQALGEKRAVQTLFTLAKDRRRENRVIVLCRMLFTKKKNMEFRRPAIGGAAFFGHTGYADWPLEPIELVNGIPFLITYGYSGSGRPEHPTRYLEYCLQNCDWNTTQFKPKGEQEKKAALNKLMASLEWKQMTSLKWQAPLNPYERSFLSSQIK